MKTLIFSFLLLCVADRCAAQTGSFKHRMRDQTHCPVVYLDVASGINNPGGIFSLGVDFNIIGKLSGFGGAGIGWGGRAYAGLRYFSQPCHEGWTASAGMSYATGLPVFTLRLPTESGKTEQAGIDCHQALNAFIGIGKYWRVGVRHNKRFVHVGWALPVKWGGYTQTSGNRLAEDVRKTLNVLSPGGLMISFGKSITGDTKNPAFRR